MFRNYDFEKKIITAAVIDRIIANALYEPDKLRNFMPVANCNDSIVTNDGLLKINLGMPFFCPPINLWQQMSETQIFSLRQDCEVKITYRCPLGFDSIINGSPALHSVFPALRLSQYPNVDGIGKDLSQAEQLKMSLNLQTGWNHPWPYNGGNWAPSYQPLLLNQSYNCLNFSGLISEQFIIIYNASENWYAVLPVTLFNNFYTRQQFVAFMPSKSPRAFYNENLLSQYPASTVYLTTDILKAINTPAFQDRFYLANLGHDEWLDALDFSLMRGRRVVIEVENPLEHQYTINLIKKLKSHGITPEVITMFPILNNQSTLLI